MHSAELSEDTEKEQRGSLQEALEQRNWTAVRQLVHKDADVNELDSTGYSALHYAADDDNEEMVRFLIEEANADVNLRSSDRAYAPLHLASKKGHWSVANALLNAKANPNLEQNDGWSPLLYASVNGHPKVVDLLISHRAKVNHQSKTGCTSLQSAARKGYQDIVLALMRAGADVDLQHSSGWTPLHQAASGGYLAVLNALIEAGADVNKQQDRGWSPLFLAARMGQVQMVESLVRAKSTISPQDKKGCTPLHIAVKYSHLPVVDALLANGADVSVKSQKQSTPLDIACQLGNSSAMQSILHYIRLNGIDIDACIMPSAAIVANECMQALNSVPEDSAATAPLTTSDSLHTDLSNELSSQMSLSGFRGEMATLQSAAADVLQVMERCRRDVAGIFIVGSFSDGWGSCLTQLNGSIEPESDIDVTTLIVGREFHIDGRCSGCDPVDIEDRVQYENGHVTCDGKASTPTDCYQGSRQRPAFDYVRAYRCCCYPYMEVLHNDNRTTQLPQSLLNELRDEAAQQGCHLVSAASPGLEGKQLRVSTTFLEKILMRSLTTVQGQLFILLKYLVKKVIGHKVKGLKTYHAKCLLFHMLDTTPSDQWEPHNLLDLTRKALHMLLDSLHDSESQSNECMRHFFMRDAAVYLKNPHDDRQKICESLSEAIEQLPQLLTKFKRKLHRSCGIFHFHPFLLLPSVWLNTHKISGNVEYHHIYDVVGGVLEQLSQQHCSEESVTTDIDRIPNCAFTARETLRSMACLKFNKVEDAKQMLTSYLSSGRSVSRGIQCAEDMAADAASVDKVWQHLKQSDSAYKFCFRMSNRPVYSFLTEFVKENFPIMTNNYYDYFFVNFDALMKSLCFEFIGEHLSTRSLLADLLSIEDPDVQELLVVLHYCTETDVLVELIHSHRRVIADHNSTADAVESLMQQPELHKASSLKSLTVLKQQLSSTYESLEFARSLGLLV